MPAVAHVRPALLVMTTLLMAGCGPTTTSQALLGKWEGSPDSLQAKRDRNPIPTAPGWRPPAPKALSAAEQSAAEKLAAMQPSETTDLEAFDFAVSLEFLPQNRVVMTLDGGQKLDGSWKVLSTDVGVSLIELVDGVPPADPEAPQPELTKRRFLLEMDEDQDAFTLREEGVDPRFGWLYFRRVAS